jgi:hypothetical protein
MNVTETEQHFPQCAVEHCPMQDFHMIYERLLQRQILIPHSSGMCNISFREEGIKRLGCSVT